MFTEKTYLFFNYMLIQLIIQSDIGHKAYRLLQAICKHYFQ